MFGEQRVMPDGWLEQARNNVQARNANLYQSELNKAKEDYKNLDILSKIQNGFSEGNYLKNHGFTDEMNELGKAGLLSTNDFWQNKSLAEQDLTNKMAKGPSLEGIPVIGGLLDTIIQPMYQTFDAGRDLVGGITTGNWENWNNRDHLKDAGALATTALGFTGVGNLARGASLAAKAGAGALLGAGQNATYNLYENGKDTTLGGLAGDALLGGAIGGAIPFAGKALGNITSKGARRIVDGNIAKNNLDLSSKQYQNALQQAQAGALGKLNSFRRGITPTTNLGKAGALGSIAGGGMVLNGLLNRNETPMYDNYYYGGY